MSTMSAVPGVGTARAAARRPVPRPAPPAGSVRLTRRGRLVLLSAFVGVLFGAFTWLGEQSAATDEAGAPVETRMVMVGEGDTLWAIASEVAEPGEIREMVYQIQELNALPSAGLAQGQRLAVPVG